MRQNASGKFGCLSRTAFVRAASTYFQRPPLSRNGGAKERDLICCSPTNCRRPLGLHLCRASCSYRWVSEWHRGACKPEECIGAAVHWHAHADGGAPAIKAAEAAGYRRAGGRGRWRRVEGIAVRSMGRPRRGSSSVRSTRVMSGFVNRNVEVDEDKSGFVVSFDCIRRRPGCIHSCSLRTVDTARV